MRLPSGLRQPKSHPAYVYRRLKGAKLSSWGEDTPNARRAFADLRAYLSWSACCRHSEPARAFGRRRCAEIAGCLDAFRAVAADPESALAYGRRALPGSFDTGHPFTRSWS